MLLYMKNITAKERVLYSKAHTHLRKETRIIYLISLLQRLNYTGCRADPSQRSLSASNNNVCPGKHGRCGNHASVQRVIFLPVCSNGTVYRCSRQKEGGPRWEERKPRRWHHRDRGAHRTCSAPLFSPAAITLCQMQYRRSCWLKSGNRYHPVCHAVLLAALSGLLLIRQSAVGLAEAVYKQWIPNTNFENASNWHEQRVPCSQDKVVFPNGQSVSVYVQSMHSLTEMHIPWDGEFILAPGAGFSASFEGDPECDKGSEIHFQDPDQYQWFDPTLWSLLHPDDGLFSVDAELVPCQYDDVIFSPDTSFRVITKATGAAITLKSISVLGKTFTTKEQFSQHLQTNTGKLQFPGSPQMHVTNLPCDDASGCECGNGEVLQEICSALQHSKGKCPSVPCASPLQPYGHCCKICGALILLEYMPTFSLDNYRDHLIQTFLKQTKYSGAKLAISKVPKQPGGVRNTLGLATEIQIAITDPLEDSQTGSAAIWLATDIMDEINNNGISFGISKATARTSASGQTAPGTGPNEGGRIAGIVVGVLVICSSILGLLYFLRKAGIIRSHSGLTSGGDDGRVETDTEPKGFDNPMFEAASEEISDVPGLRTGEELLKDITLEQSNFNFGNPFYECSRHDKDNSD